MQNIEQEAERILKKIDTAGDPGNMTQAQWVEFLEMLIADLQDRLDAAREGMGEG